MGEGTREFMALVSERPLGLRAKSAPWLRGVVYKLGRQVERLEREVLEYRATYCEDSTETRLLEHQLGGDWISWWGEDEWSEFRAAQNAPKPSHGETSVRPQRDTDTE